MMTPILRKYESRLVEVNDQLIYFLFSDAEVETHLEENIKYNEDKYTTDIFPDNQFSERLHIKASALTEFRKQSFNTLVGVSLIAAVEYMLYYIEEVEGYRASVLPSSHDSLRDNKPEQQIANKIKAWGGNGADSAIIKTIKYLRLRRNHIAHLREEMSQEFNSLIKNDANHINSYWGSKKTDIYNFDFSNPHFLTFSVNEALALINLTRICLKIIDEEVLSTISMPDIAQYEIIKFLKNKSLNGLPITKRARKFRGVLQSKYGASIDCTEEDFERYANNA